jgi:cyclopropane fatty-acyl-phospholipid synthase-like methyltransferase
MLENLYRTKPPWDIDRPQPAFLALANAIRGRVLDAGCGTGEHALMAAGLGLAVTGVDLATNALATAERKARERGLTVRFLRHDARKLGELGESFDTVLDCGLFHIFTGDDRAAYVDDLRTVLAPGGRYFMLGFSDKQPEGAWARVHRLTEDEITTTFADGWRIDAVDEATIEITADPHDIPAWLVALTRLPEKASC